MTSSSKRDEGLSPLPTDHSPRTDDFLRKTTDLHVTHEILVQLEKSKRASENIVYNLPELVFIVDIKGRILKGNRASESILHQEAGELIYRRMSRLFSERTWKIFWNQALKISRSGDPDCTAEFDLPTDGINIQVRHFHWNIRMVNSLSQRRGPLLYVVGHDITDIRMMFEEIKESHQKLEQHSRELEALLDTIQRQKIQLVESSKLAQLGEMAGGIAHEINNPITIIKGHAEHLKYILEKSEDVEPSLLQRSTTVITNTVDRVSAIVNSMRTLARDGSKEPFHRTNLITVLKDSLVFFKEKFKVKEINLTTNYPDEPVMLQCRGVQISQVFINLISNAIDAVASQEDRWVRVDIIPGEDKVVISVTDSGPTIDEGIVEKIMQPFFTTKPIGSGTGLGLSITRAIIQQHKGHLRLNRDHPNTQFVIELPVTQEKEETEGSSVAL